MIENINKKLLLIILPPLVLFLAFLVFFALINRSSLRVPFFTEEKPSPYPTLGPVSEGEAGASPSAYLNHEGVKRIEASLKSLEKDLDTVDLDEFSLRPPLLDLEVKF